MRLLKAAGVAVGVFVVWFIGASLLAAANHVGQTYDPTFGGGTGAWFVDYSPAGQSALAIWMGKAIVAGVVVALACGVAFYWRGRARPTKPPIE